MIIKLYFQILKLKINKLVNNFNKNINLKLLLKIIFAKYILKMIAKIIKKFCYILKINKCFKNIKLIKLILN